jgi:hypothetical protein
MDINNLSKNNTALFICAELAGTITELLEIRTMLVTFGYDYSKLDEIIKSLNKIYLEIKKPSTYI